MLSSEADFAWKSMLHWAGKHREPYVRAQLGSEKSIRAEVLAAHPCLCGVERFKNLDRVEGTRSETGLEMPTASHRAMMFPVEAHQNSH